MHLASRRSVRVGLAILSLAFLIYASARVVHHQLAAGQHSIFHDYNQFGDGDWGVYYRAGLAMRLRLPLYTLEHGPLLTFKNPPAVALLIAPLTMLSVGWARWIWLVGEFACLFFVYLLAARVVFTDRDPSPLRAMLVAGAIILSFHYILDELFAGTTSLLYLLMTVGAFVWAKEDKPIRAGAALALAVCLKLVPLAFLPWLVLCRRPGRSLSSFLGTLALLMVLPALWLGPNRNLSLLRQWPQHLAQTEIRVQDYRVTNQSLGAMLTRLLTPMPDLPGLYKANLVSLSQQTAHAMWLVVSCLLALAIYGWIFLQRRRGRLDAAAALSLLLLFMTLCNPLAWRYTYIAVGIPILFVLRALSHGIRHGRVVIALLAASYVLHFAPEHLQAFSARFWGTVGLGLALMLCRRLKTADDPGSSGTFSFAAATS
jgi:cbb3-type cytochrome oxidase subunit 3